MEDDANNLLVGRAQQLQISLSPLNLSDFEIWTLDNGLVY